MPCSIRRGGKRKQIMTDTDSITTVVFDLGGVLIDWNPRHLYRKIFDDETKIDWFLDTICTRPWHEQQDAGGSAKDATDSLAAEHPGYEKEILAFYDRFDEMLGGPIKGTVDVLRALKAQETPLYALSNWPAETFPDGTPPYDFLTWFDGLVVSGREGVMKPDPKIFDLLCTRYELTPSSCLFVDDVEHNVQAAAALGFNVHHFTGANRLLQDLQQHGLLHET